MRTVRILDLRRGHLRAEFVPKLRVESFHRSDSEGCTIVIIDRPSPDRFSTGPLYMCAPRTRALAPSTPSRAFLLYRTDLPTLPRTTPFCVSAEVLANLTIRNRQPDNPSVNTRRRKSRSRSIDAQVK